MNPKRLPNGRWQADWRSLDGQRTRKTYRTKEAAERALRAALDARDRGEVPKPPVPTLREFIDNDARRVIRKRVAAMTWQNYDRSLKLHVLPVLGDEKLSNIDGPVIQRWISGLETGATTVHRSFAALAAILKLGSQMGLCAAAPSKRALDLPKITIQKFQPPTVAEIEALADAIDPRFHALILVAGYCGLRQGELFALKAEDIEGGKIHVRRSLARDGEVKGTKSGRDRLVTMPTMVKLAVRQHSEVYGLEDSWVFHRDGRPLDWAWFNTNAWNPARKKAGVECRFHDLRHACVGIMANVYGYDPYQTAMEIGHYSGGQPNPGFTLSRYGHLWPRDARGQLERMDTALSEILLGAVRAVKEPGVGLEPTTSRLQNADAWSDRDSPGDSASDWHPHG